MATPPSGASMSLTTGRDGYGAGECPTLLRVQEGRDVLDKDKGGTRSLHKTGNGIGVVFADLWLALVAIENDWQGGDCLFNAALPVFIVPPLGAASGITGQLD